MNKELIQDIYTVQPDNLLAGTAHTAVKEVVELDKYVGELKRGSLILKTDAGYEAAGTTENTGNAYAILAEDIDMSEETGETVGVVAYISGDFSKEAILTLGDYEISASDVDSLRQFGIYLR